MSALIICITFLASNAMQKFQVTLSAQEAATLVAALGFIRQNLIFSADDGLWKLVPGTSLSFGMSEVVMLEDLKAMIFDSYTDALERHPFAPFIKAY